MFPHPFVDHTRVKELCVAGYVRAAVELWLKATHAPGADLRLRHRCRWPEPRLVRKPQQRCLQADARQHFVPPQHRAGLHLQHVVECALAVRLLKGNQHTRQPSAAAPFSIGILTTWWNVMLLAVRPPTKSKKVSFLRLSPPKNCTTHSCGPATSTSWSASATKIKEHTNVPTAGRAPVLTCGCSGSATQAPSTMNL